MEYTLTKEKDGTDFDYVDQNGVSHESPADWVWHFLGGCGCGNADNFAERSLKVLNHFALEHDKRDFKEVNPYENNIDELLAHWMDKEGIVEHGTSVCSGWLTEKGKAIHKAVSML